MSTPHTSHIDVDTLADLGEGLLEADQVTSVAEHLDRCAECRARRDALDDVQLLLRDLGAGADAPAPDDVVRRLDDASARIYRTRLEDWDGIWHLLVTDLPTERSRRDRLRAGLTFLGYAQLDDATWIGPRWSEEVDLLLETEGVRAERFLARHDGDSLGLVRRAWDIEGLSRAYGRWLADAEQVVGDATSESGDEQAFATRSRLVHEWRKFLFLDPGLPLELLPVPWAGEEAADFFDAESGRLQVAASRFVDQCLSTAPDPALRSNPNSPLRSNPNSPLRSKEGLDT